MNTSSKIDAEILTVASPAWQKVDTIISRVSRNLDSSFNECHPDEILYSQIASRIETLVLFGKLISHGNLRSRQHSEVRLAFDDFFLKSAAISTDESTEQGAAANP